MAVLKGKLTNCLEYYICKTPYNHCNSVYLYNKAGSRYEKDEEIGISHFLEHMCLGFAKQIPYRSLANGATFFEHTHYKIRVDKTDEIQNGLIMLKRILLGETIIPDQIDEIREDIIREWNNCYYSETYSMRKTILGELFGVDLISRFPLGSYNNILKIDIENVLAHHKKFYTTDSSAIICVGDIDLLNTEKQIKLVFEELETSRICDCKSYLTTVLRESKYVRRFSALSSKEVTAELYCSISVNNKAYSYHNTFFNIVILFSLIEDTLKEQLQLYQIVLNQCSIYENRIIKEYSLVSFDMPCSSDNTIETRIISECLNRVINRIKKGQVSKRAFQQARKSALTGIRKKHDTVNLLEKCMMNFIYHDIDFSIDNEMKRYQECFDNCQISDAVEMCKTIFGAI